MNNKFIFLVKVLIIKLGIIVSAINIDVISDCDNNFNISLFQKIARNSDKSINFRILKPPENYFCGRNAFKLLVNRIQDNSLNAIIGAIDNDYCELTEKLSNLYYKFVITWNCTDLIITKSRSSPYFLRMTKALHLQNGVIVLTDILFQLKWKNAFIIVVNSSYIIGNDRSVENFTFKIQQLFYEKNLVITDLIFVGEQRIDVRMSLLRKLTKIVSLNVKCK